MKFQEIKLFREILAVFKLKFIVRSPNNVYMQGQLLYLNLTSTKFKTFTITQARPNRCKSTIASICPFGQKYARIVVRRHHLDAISFPKLEESCEQFQVSKICSAKNPKRKARKVDARRVDGFLEKHEIFHYNFSLTYIQFFFIVSFLSFY